MVCATFFSREAMFSLIPALLIFGGNPIFIDQFYQALS